MAKTLTRQRRGPYYSEGARRLRRYLKSADKSTSALASELGVGRTSVFRWLYGDRRVPLSAALAIERAAGVPVAAWERMVAA